MTALATPVPRLPALAGALLGLTMLLLIRRYWGIDHDATLYLGQALAQRWPGNFGNDLFFLHGSQGHYTLFPWLTGWLVGWFDPIAVFFWGGLAGLLLFAAASWYCLRVLLPEGQRYWAWLGVLVLPSFYGRAIIFSYAEPFLTPRAFAEGLCLVAIGLLSRGRHVGAWACVLVAGMLHPLQAIAGLLVIWPWLVMRDRRWLHALWLALPASLAGLVGIEPFDGLFAPLDGAWLATLRAINGQLFISGWAVMDYRIMAFDVLLLACAARIHAGAFAPWCIAAVVGLGMGIIASLLLVDVLHLALPAGLQLWRVHWLAHWFAMAALAVLLFHAARRADAAQALLLVLTGLLAWGAAEWIWLPFGLLYIAWPGLATRVRPHVRRLLGWLFGLGILLLLLQYVGTELANFRMAHGRLDLYALDRRLFAFPLLALGLPLAGVYLWRNATSTARSALLVLVLCPAIVVAATRWDIRAPSRRALDAHAHVPALFGATIPGDALVYWDGVGLLGTWSVLRRADYYDPQQLSGLVFNKGTVDDASGRIARMTPLMTESMACEQARAASEPHVRCRISDTSMQQACGAGALPRPDYLVLPYRQPQRSLGSWTMEDTSTGEAIATYWLYRCTDVMTGGANGQPATPAATNAKSSGPVVAH
ncbi:MAG TPA: hypothetical protein VLC71_00205 [Thermomonas sp.]|nr:hypothetical protein [Thermomonas sp.]